MNNLGIQDSENMSIRTNDETSYEVFRREQEDQLKYSIYFSRNGISEYEVHFENCKIVKTLSSNYIVFFLVSARTIFQTEFSDISPLASYFEIPEISL